MHFIIDCDGVLLDWQRGFRSWVFRHRGVRPLTDEPQSWSLAEWLGLDEHECRTLIEQFNASQEFGQLAALPDAVDAVGRLHRAGHRLTVLTSCSSRPEIANRRRENLRREFGQGFDRVICLDLHECKRTWLDVLRPGVWIEDNYRNALQGMYAGNKTFMLRRSHNRADEIAGDDRIQWIDDWRPIISLFS